MAVTKIPKKTVTLIEPKKSFIVDKAQHRQKRVAAYCRVSTDSEEQLTSYTNQMKVYTEMIAANKEWEFAGLYADEGISGTRADKRPQFQKMIEDCFKGKIDMIITKSVSRFARNTVDCLDYVRSLKEIGVGIYFEEQNIDTLKSDSELYLIIYAGFAQSESESISKNITWTQRKKFEDGKVTFMYSRTLGYKKGEDGNPEIVPEEAKAGGAKVVATGRSDFPNQVNNVLAFPGIFRGALDVQASDINDQMKIAAAYALAELVSEDELCADYVLPAAFDPRVGPAVAKAVAQAARDTGVARK